MVLVLFERGYAATFVRPYLLFRHVITMAHRNDPSFLPLGTDGSEATESDAAKLPPSLQQYALNLYRDAWQDYRAVGCPYGRTDDAMLVWYSLYGIGDGPALVSGKN